MFVDSPEHRLKLVNTLPNDLRYHVRQMARYISVAEAQAEEGQITDPQLNNYYTLLYLTLRDVGAVEKAKGFARLKDSISCPPR